MLDHMASVCLVLLETDKASSKVAVLFPPAVNKISCRFLSSPAFGIISVCTLATPIGV